MRPVLARLTALLALGGTMVALSACSVPVPEDVAGAEAPSPAAAVASSPAEAAPTTCTSNYHAGIYSLDMIMQNNTGQTLTLDPTWTGRGDGHWAARPPATLAPGACAVINAYSDDPTAGLWLTATYQLPDSTFIPFACAAENLDGGDATCFTGAYTTMKGMEPDQLVLGTLSDSWQLNIAASSGTDHTHWTLVAESESQ